MADDKLRAATESGRWQAQVARYAMLSEVVLLIAKSSDLERLLNEATNKIKWVIDFERCTLGLLNSDGESYQLQTLLETRKNVPRVERERVPLERGIPGEVIHTRQMRLVPDLAAAPTDLPAFADPAMEDGLLASILSLPLQAYGKVLGAITFGTIVADGYDRESIKLMLSFATHLALAIDRWQQSQELQRANEELRREITERMQAEASLRESEERFRILSEAAFEGIAFTEDGRVLDGNEALARMLGYEKGELIGMNVRDTHPPEYRDLTGDHNLSRYKKAYEAECLRKDGSVFPVEIRGRPVPYQGRTVRVTAIRDITERKQAELELAKLRQLEKTAALGKVSAGLAHDLNNPAAVSLRAAQELTRAIKSVGTQSMTLGRMSLTPEQWKLLSSVKEEASTNQSAPAPLDPLGESELEDRISDWLEEHDVAEGWKLAPTFAKAGLSAERLEALAGALPEQTYAIAFSWLERSLAADALIREAGKAAHRISELVTAVKSYSFMDQAPRQDVDIHQGLEDTLTILGHKLKKHDIAVHRELDPNLPRIEAFGAELNQVWTNLIDNAIDAIGLGGGEIHLRTSREPNAVTVEVADNGPGIPEEIQSKVFDPFFTTKDVGEGSGLGLQIVRRIVCETHKGEITLDSKPGETRFRVRLPISGCEASM